MPSPAPPSHLWILSAEGVFPGIERSLARHDWVVHRVTSVRFRNEPVDRLRERLRRWGRFDTVVVTSRQAIAAFVRPVLLPEGHGHRDREVWAAGAATAHALRSLGFHRVRRAPQEGAAPIAEALATGRVRSIIYPRSDRAGPGLARRLHASGHRVLDLVAYRTLPAVGRSRPLERALRNGHVLLVTSPSALAALRAMIAPEAFHRLRGQARIVAIGERTRRSAQGHGFRGVGRLPSASLEGLTAYLAREGRHATR